MEAPWDKAGVANEVGRTEWRTDVDTLAIEWAPINEKRKAEAAARKAARKAAEAKKAAPIVAAAAVTPADSPAAAATPVEDAPARLDSDDTRKLIEETAVDGAPTKRAHDGDDAELEAPSPKRSRRSSSATFVGEPVAAAELNGLKIVDDDQMDVDGEPIQDSDDETPARPSIVPPQPPFDDGDQEPEPHQQHSPVARYVPEANVVQDEPEVAGPSPSVLAPPPFLAAPPSSQPSQSSAPAFSVSFPFVQPQAQPSRSPSRDPATKRNSAKSTPTKSSAPKSASQERQVEQRRALKGVKERHGPAATSNANEPIDLDRDDDDVTPAVAAPARAPLPPLVDMEWEDGPENAMLQAADAGVADSEDDVVLVDQFAPKRS